MDPVKDRKLMQLIHEVCWLREKLEQARQDVDISFRRPHIRLAMREELCVFPKEVGESLEDFG